MKKLLLALACAGLISCSRQQDPEICGYLSIGAGLAVPSAAEPAQPYFRPVRSGPGMQEDSLRVSCVRSEAFPSTKAALQTSMYGSFGLFGYAFNGSWDGNTPPLYIYNERCRLQGGSYVTDNQHHHLASSRCSVRFMAYAPYGCPGLELSPQTRPGAFSMRYTVPSDVDEQVDLMAGRSQDCNVSPAAPYINFEHVLTAVRFTTGSVSPSRGTVKSVAIRGVYGRGLYCQDSGWSELDSRSDYSQALSVNPDGSSGLELTSSSQNFLLIPQTLPEGALLEMVYDDGRGPVTLSCSIAGDVWKAGELNTYRLCFSRDEVVGAELVGGNWRFSYPSDIPAAGGSVLPVIPDLKMLVSWASGRTETVGLDDSRISTFFSVTGATVNNAVLSDASSGEVTGAYLAFRQIFRTKVASLQGRLCFEDDGYVKLFYHSADVYQEKNQIEDSELLNSWDSDPQILDKQYEDPYTEEGGWAVSISCDRFTSVADQCPASGGSATMTVTASHQERQVTPWSQVTFMDRYWLYRDTYTSGAVGTRTMFETYYYITDYGEDCTAWQTVEDEAQVSCAVEGVSLVGNTLTFSPNNSLVRRIATFFATNGDAEDKVTVYQSGI